MGWLCNDQYLSPGLWKSGFKPLCFHRSSMTLGKAPLPFARTGALLQGQAEAAHHI